MKVLKQIAFWLLLAVIAVYTLFPSTGRSSRP